MATYTDNYQLLKPTYAEQADIGVINSNMNKIDEIMHSSQISLADAYDSTKAYAEGDVVMYELLMYKCISPTKGVWDASKWERTTAAETGGGGSVDFDIFGEASGKPASFADGSASALVECETEIVPTQDLHGYDKPWAGGTGKNQAEGRYTWNINASGEIIESSTYATCIVKVSQGTIYTFSVDGVKAQIDVIAYFTSYPQAGSTSYNNSRDTFIDGTFTAPITGYATIRMSASIGDMMVENGSSASSYEPYSNICPISGHSSVTINVSPTSDSSQGVDTTIQLGNTYYSGTLNAITGELIVTHECVSFDGSENWQIMTGAGVPHAFRLDGSWGAKVVRVGTANGFSNKYEYSLISLPDYGYRFADNNPNTLYIYDQTYNNDLAGFKTSLVNINMQMLFELATPITVQLTPTVINTLLGQNYISSEDTEDIDVVYTKSGAPIKPNPTGAAVRELNKIELDGEVFNITGGESYLAPLIYSTEEREVGVWIDNKPLYQKSYRVQSLPNASAVEYSLGISNIDSVAFLGCIAESSSVALPLFYNAGNDNGSKIQIHLSDKATGKVTINTFGDNRSSMSGTVVIQYTKTTDTAGSGSYNTLGVPTVHYLQGESVIGTWVDGKTLYRYYGDLDKSIGTSWVQLPELNTLNIATCIKVVIFAVDYAPAFDLQYDSASMPNEIIRARNATFAAKHILLEYTKTS